jgi:dipeptidyl aminopeptidase/acylaminoacyl peptidase
LEMVDTDSRQATMKLRRTSSPSGTVYWPADHPPIGGVVCLHGSEGARAGWNDLTCAMLAANGFAALAHGYNGKGAHPDHLNIDDVPLEGTVSALEWLKGATAEWACRIGLFGASRGAEMALLLAQLLAEDGHDALPDAVAVHSPPDAIWPAYIFSDFHTGKAWAGDWRRPAWSWKGAHDRTRPGLPLAAEHYPGPIFVTQGEADQVWSAEMAHRLVARLTAAGRAPEAHFFEGEDHVLRSPANDQAFALLVAFFSRHLPAPASR